MPQLAESFRQVAKHGKDIFYTGELAERIVKESQAMGGLYTADDFASYEARWQTPVAIDYRGFRAHTVPPNCSGFQTLQILKLLEGFEPSELVFQDPATLHRQIEATKLCITDRAACAGDPDYVDVPVEALLSDGYAASQKERINADEAAVLGSVRYQKNRPVEALAPGSPAAFDEGGMTTHLAVADRDGNVGDHYADAWERVRLGHRHRRHRHILEQHGLVLRRGAGEPESYRPRKAGRVLRRPDPGPSRR